MGRHVSPAVTGAATIQELQTATTNQTVFVLVNTYVPNTKKLSVYINGVRQFPGAFAETNTNTVTFSGPLKLGDVVLFEIGVITSGTLQAASGVSFSPVSGMSQTDVQGALANVIPDPTGQAGKILWTDGTNKFWVFQATSDSLIMDSGII